MKKLMLVGGGHVHLSILKMLKSFPIPDVDVTLISPYLYQYYSGMFSGYTEGIYSESDIRINLSQMAEKASIKWMEDAVTSIDPKQKLLLTAQGNILAYDVVSFDIGSLTAGTELPGVKEYALRIKPNYHFQDAIDEARRAETPVIVGSGPVAVETALTLTTWRKVHQIKIPITVMSSGLFLPNEKKSTSKKIETLMTEKGIQVLTGKNVTKVTKKSVVTSEEQIAFDQLMWLTGTRAPEIFKKSNLPVDDEGYLLVENTLQVKKYPAIFGAGGCISLSPHRGLTNSSLIAIKQAPILYENLKTYLGSNKGEGYVFRPQKNNLTILSLGHKKGLLLYNGFAITGHWAWWLKNKMNQRFIASFQ